MKKLMGSVAVALAALAFTSCLEDDGNPSIGRPNSMASLHVVREVYRDTDVKLGPEVLTGAFKTAGTVISNPSGGNLPAGYVVIQGSWRGLMRGVVLALDAATAATYIPGDSLVIDLSGATLTRNTGPLQITGLTADKINKVASGRPVIARPVSITQLNSKFQEYESTLVSLTADAKPYPVSGETMAGAKTLDDGAGNSFTLFTDPQASFASFRIAPNATYIGIPMLVQNEKQLRLRFESDIIDPSGPLYPGYPENFDYPDQSVKNTYATKAIDLRTGNWTFNQAILGNTANRDRIVSGAQAVRFQQGLTTPAYLQMNYDLADGASKVTLWYGSYYTDVSSTFALEYSTDQGATWTEIGRRSDAHPTNQSLQAKQAVFLMDIKGPVRFRIKKLGLGASSPPNVFNGRLGMDDFAVYKSY
ncbi:DUF5689 domain-containing protein [Rufibacter quisquiliarum]|uniref:DUF5689 domain-containing protein n=1 Tax=Rufibacter quisquiliarum TaxID=1549639 RepID=A0A839GP21_9BACT|nr:DUF5689 domain-containing protein [Rufibacter quisquiliarum]MBA9076657.1 hypothetical protein [Rufibacter quisquiliarum]